MPDDVRVGAGDVVLEADQRGDLAGGGAAARGRDPERLRTLLGMPREHAVQLGDGSWLKLHVWPPTLRRMALVDAARSRLSLELLRAAGGHEALDTLRPERRWWARWRRPAGRAVSALERVALAGRAADLSELLALGLSLDKEPLWRFVATVLDPRMDAATQDELLANPVIGIEDFMRLPLHTLEAVLDDVLETHDMRPLVKKALDLPGAGGNP